MDSFIMIYRSVFDTAVAKNANAMLLLVHLAHRAAFKKQVVRYGSREVVLMPGQVIFGRSKYSEFTGLSEKEVRNALRALSRSGLVVVNSWSDCGPSLTIISLNKSISCDWLDNQRGQPTGHLTGQQEGHLTGHNSIRDKIEERREKRERDLTKEIYTQDKENIFDQKSTTPKAPQKRASNPPVQAEEATASLASRAGRPPHPSNYDYNLEYEANDPEIRASYMQDEELLALNECFPLGYATKTASRGSERENLTSSSSSQKKSLTSKAKPKKKAVTREEDEDFRRFWEVYPRKVGKEQAWKTFSRLKKNRELPSMDTLMKAVSMFTSEISELEFTPHPSTWLNGKRWEDSEVATDGTEWAPKTQTENFHTSNRKKAKMPETANMAHSEVSVQKPAPEPAPKQEPAPEPEDKDFPAVLARKYRNKEYFMTIPWYNLDPEEYEWQQMLIRKRDAENAKLRAEREAREALEGRQEEDAVQSADIVIPDPPKIAPVHSLSRGERYRKDKEEIHKKWQSFFAGAREDAKEEQEVERRRKMLLDQQERLLAETKTANQ